MNFLSVENLTKSFGDRLLFSDVSFGIDQGQKVAIVAKNGAGKTTALSIVTGLISSTSGSIDYYFSNLNDNLTAAVQVSTKYFLHPLDPTQEKK